MHIQQEQSKPGNKEEKQTEMSPMAPNHRACQQNAHIEDPLSLYDDGSLDDISDEDGRFVEWFCPTLVTYLLVAPQVFESELSKIFPKLLHS